MIAPRAATFGPQKAKIDDKQKNFFFELHDVNLTATFTIWLERQLQNTYSVCLSSTTGADPKATLFYIIHQYGGTAWA
jgi:hypothetical protein